RCLDRPRLPTPAPYTTLFRSNAPACKCAGIEVGGAGAERVRIAFPVFDTAEVQRRESCGGDREGELERIGYEMSDEVYKLPEEKDRKSTRMNSSHVKISYAVF